MVTQQFAKLRPREGSCGFEPHALRHAKTPDRPAFLRGGGRGARTG